MQGQINEEENNVVLWVTEQELSMINKLARKAFANEEFENNLEMTVMYHIGGAADTILRALEEKRDS